jgi:hypothetical protein
VVQIILNKGDINMKLKELRQELEQWDGEMEVTVLDQERNEYDFVGITMLSGKYFEPKLAIKFE